MSCAEAPLRPPTASWRRRAPRARARDGDLGQALERLDLHQLAGLDLAALVLEHDEAVRLRHRAQHARALLAGSAYFPFAAFAEHDAALVLGSSSNLSQRLRGGCLE